MSARARRFDHGEIDGAVGLRTEQASVEKSGGLQRLYRTRGLAPGSRLPVGIKRQSLRAFAGDGEETRGHEGHVFGLLGL